MILSSTSRYAGHAAHSPDASPPTPSSPRMPGLRKIGDAVAAHEQALATLGGKENDLAAASAEYNRLNGEAAYTKKELRNFQSAAADLQRAEARVQRAKDALRLAISTERTASSTNRQQLTAHSKRLLDALIHSVDRLSSSF